MQKGIQVQPAQRFQKHLPALKRWFGSDKRVLAVWLFGSLTDGYATERSDVDLAVLWAPSPVDFHDELAFEVEVCRLLGTERVDVVHLHRAPLVLRFRAVSGVLLYERDFVPVSDFIEQTVTWYQDFHITWRQFSKDFSEGVKQDYGRVRRNARATPSRNYRKQSAKTRTVSRSTTR